ncbi:DUF5829 family protein [Poritiphilus flavus]|uniref:Uncharacterized protein n=1 Tax=Poritiphilus flavus TaxID=2697053 RepID=A0A6L9E854_9FLAO|nr:DUF5829 family protein [Poritiphilus flavus]NAS10639.1 hypothetical protein [Poritiphilus flavus]
MRYLVRIFGPCCLLVAFLTGLVSCQENNPSVTSTKIDHAKIDALFGKNVSEVLFDHLYVVLDSSSYADLTQNTSWKNSYAFIDKGLPDFDVIDDQSTSCYLRGHRHYIEILGPHNEYKEPVGKSGIGFSLRNKGEHFHLGVKPRLKQAGSSYLSNSEVVDMPIGNQEATWFKAFYSPSAGSWLDTWYAFYNPAFLDSLYHKEHPDYSREDFLQQSYSKDRLFEGIREISLSCTPEDYKRIGQELRFLGCRLLEKKGDRLSIGSGDITINISPSNTVEFSRITRIHCGINAEDFSVIKLGNITITNRGKESIWNLENLYKDYH